MISLIKQNDSQIKVIARQIRAHCLEFSRNQRDVSKWTAALQRIRELIEFIPMASDDFGVAVSRINNASRYLESIEFGAAQYEIRLLLGVLRQNLSSVDLDVTDQKAKVDSLNVVASNIRARVCTKGTV